MTDTTTTHEAAPAATEEKTSLIPTHSGLAGVLGSGDHKTIGRLYIGFSLVFGLAAFAALAVFDLSIKTDSALVDADKAFSAFTLGQLALVLLFLVPLFIGLATAVVPLQVGARTIAFPRAAAAAFWVWLLSSVGFLVGYAINGSIGNGGDLNAQTLTLLSLGGTAIALLLASVCIATTVVAFRPTGMALDRVPLFSWSMLAATGVWLLTLPVFVGNIALIFVDVKYGTASGFGVGFQQWSQLGWLVSQPQVFAFAIPALGIIGDVVATFARARMPQRGIMLTAIGAFAILGFGAYAQITYNPHVHEQFFFLAQSLLLIIPLLLVLGGVAMTFRKGSKPKVTGPVILGIASLLGLLLAAVVGALLGTGRLGLQGTPKALLEGSQALRAASSGGPIFTWGIAWIVVISAATAAIGGIFYWSPKLTGRTLPDGLGKLLGPVMLVAAVVAGAPMIVLAFAAKQPSLADSAAGMYVLAAAGAGLAALGLLLTFAVFAQSRATVASGGAGTDPDPWGVGQSLEWATDSPPATGNFGELAAVTSPEPLLDAAGSDSADSEGDD